MMHGQKNIKLSHLFSFLTVYYSLSSYVINMTRLWTY